MENVINYFIYEDNKDVIGHLIVDMGDKLPTTNEISVFDHLLSFSPLNELPVTAEKIHVSYFDQLRFKEYICLPFFVVCYFLFCRLNLHLPAQSQKKRWNKV